MVPWESPDRFNLLLLEEKEYYFKDYFCHYHPQGSAQRVAGHLKVCSASVFFVPRNLHEPIFRVEYRNTSSIDRCGRPFHYISDTEEEFFVINARERTDMKIGNRNTPYVRHKGEFAFHFALVYTSLAAMLPRLRTLHELSQAPTALQVEKLARLVKQHEDQVHFNTGWFEEPTETLLLELVGSRITPLVSQPGRAVITCARVYFQPFNVVSSAPIVKYNLDREVTSIVKRNFNLEEIGVEIFFSGWNSVYFTFKNRDDRNTFYDTLVEQPGLTLQKMRSREKWVRDWIFGKVSNFDYLMYLNREADRSFNDLTQYPVFPWVIADYSSSQLDLRNPATFRDLSKPIGALNKVRLANFKDRYSDMLEMRKAGLLDTVPFLYGCHYSTPGYVVYYKVRSEPQLMLRLQNGKFDMPDRLLTSIAETWNSVYHTTTDLKELIPEFYSGPSTFLVNKEGLDFGEKQNGARVGDVELPPWAKNPEDFVRKLREALECPYISRRLNRWIDLIFGCKQRGPAAEAADNVFHYLTYDDIGAAELEGTTDPELRKALKLQISEFGRTPKQLFTTAHPRKHRRPLRFLSRCFQGQGWKHRPTPFPLPRVETKLPQLAHLGSKRFNRKYKSLGQMSPISEMARSDRSVNRAIEKLSSQDPEVREIAVSWLEESASAREPELLEVGGPEALQPLVSLAASRKQDQRIVAMRALRALAMASKPNRRHMLQAGAMEWLLDTLSTGEREASRAAALVVAELSAEESPLLLNFQMEPLISLINLVHSPDSDATVRALLCNAIANLCTSSRSNRKLVSQLKAANWLFLLAKGHPEAQGTAQMLVREKALYALAALAVDPEVQKELVELGVLKLAIHTCENEQGPVQVAAVWLLSAFSANESLKLDIAAAGGLRLLCNFSCAVEDDLRGVASSALGQLCGDAAIINAVVREEGLWSVIAMAQSPTSEVQRLAARAFWHLAVHHENKKLVLSMGGLQSLLTLSRLGDRNPQATLLAEEALQRLADDPEVRAQLETEEDYRMRKLSFRTYGDSTPSPSHAAAGLSPLGPPGDVRSLHSSLPGSASSSPEPLPLETNPFVTSRDSPLFTSNLSDPTRQSSNDGASSSNGLKRRSSGASSRKSSFDFDVRPINGFLDEGAGPRRRSSNAGSRRGSGSWGGVQFNGFEGLSGNGSVVNGWESTARHSNGAQVAKVASMPSRRSLQGTLTVEDWTRRMETPRFEELALT